MVDLPAFRQWRLLLGIDQRLWIAPEEQVGDDENDSADSAADRNAAAAGTPLVLNVVTFPSALPEHRSVEWRGSLVFTNAA